MTQKSKFALPWLDIENTISEQTHQRFVIKDLSPITGGCINTAYKVSDGNKYFFVKTNDAHRVAMFAAEVAGLVEIYTSNSLRCPKPIGYGSSTDTAFLVLEYLDISDNKTNYRLFGQQIAAMHNYQSSEFGWKINNTIGSTHQNNQTSRSWVDFFREHRLGYQLKLAADNGYIGSLQRNGEKLLADLAMFFSTYQPTASLVHGDLWSGNYGSLFDGTPVIFDPAVYYGDRETDIAMTELFGGFPPGFYSAYQEIAPLDSGYRTRKTLYNLYHILNHLNLFGSSYLTQAEAMINSLLAEIN